MTAVQLFDYMHDSRALVGGAGAKDAGMTQQHQVVLVQRLHMPRQVLDPVLQRVT